MISEGGDDCRILIFVKMIKTARSLASSFKRSQFLRKLNPESIVGQTEDDISIQSDLIERFKSGTKKIQKLSFFNNLFLGDIKLLVSTSVLEEGIDVSNCNLVISFEGDTLSFKSYIQIRGRARHRNSKFIIFYENNSNQMVILYFRISCLII